MQFDRAWIIYYHRRFSVAADFSARVFAAHAWKQDSRRVAGWVEDSRLQVREFTRVCKRCTRVRQVFFYPMCVYEHCTRVCESPRAFTSVLREFAWVLPVPRASVSTARELGKVHERLRAVTRVRRGFSCRPCVYERCTRVCESPRVFTSVYESSAWDFPVPRESLSAVRKFARVHERLRVFTSVYECLREFGRGFSCPTCFREHCTRVGESPRAVTSGYESSQGLFLSPVRL